jgi:transketolase C-terminal domain/subunit
MGLKDVFGQSGQTPELLKKYKLDDKAIETTVKKIITR